MSARYEVVLGPAAIRAVLGLPDPERKELAEALRTELLDGPNADKEARFDADMRACDNTCQPGDVVYRGTPLSFGSYVAVHRFMTRDELRRLRREQGHRVAALGFYVLEILHPASAFTRSPRLAGRL
jgi:hypothetical protein